MKYIKVVGLMIALAFSMTFANMAAAKTLHFDDPWDAITYDGGIFLKQGDSVSINYERASWLNFGISQWTGLGAIGTASIYKKGLKDLELFAVTKWDRWQGIHWNFADLKDGMLTDFTIVIKNVLGGKIGVSIDAEGYNYHPAPEAPAPVPLPAAGFLMLAGLGALGLTRMRRRA